MWKIAKVWLLLLLMFWSASGQVVYAHYCWTKKSMHLRLGKNHSSPCAKQEGAELCCTNAERQKQIPAIAKPCASKSNMALCCLSDTNKNDAKQGISTPKSLVWKKHCCDQHNNWWRPGLDLPKTIKEVKQWTCLGFLLPLPKAFFLELGHNETLAASRKHPPQKAGPNSGQQLLSLLQVYRI